MMNLIRAFTLFFLFTPAIAFANQIQISGTIYDAEGVVPFAHIFLEGTTKGTVSNETGQFSFSVPEGVHILVVRAIGFETYKKDLRAFDHQENLQIILTSRDVSLEEVIVKGDEDPAYEIMRQVIARRDQHHRAVDGYSCNAYLKGLNRIIEAPDEIFGIPVNFLGILDTNNTGIVYLSESESEFHFQQPDKVREVMHASKVSGNTQAFSWNMASDFLFSLYQSRISQEVIARRVIISPLADNAFFYYRFRLTNSTNEDGILVYHIDFEPRRKNDPVMTGSLQINHGLWNIRHSNVFMFKENGLNFVDTLQITQSFVPVKDSIWLPMTQHFEFSFELFDIKAEGYFTGVYSNYELNPDFPDGFFSNEIMKISDGANELGETIWNNIRPVPLTEEEKKDYEAKDSLEILRQSKPFLDSLDRDFNRYGLWNVVLGYRYRNSYKDRRVWLTPIVTMTQYNTVEGLRFAKGVRFRQTNADNLYHEVEGTLRYGTASQTFYGKGGYSHFYSRHNQGQFSVQGGLYPYQYNENESIAPIGNTFYTLVIKENHKKIYRKGFGRVNWEQEVFNGGVLSLSGGYEHRQVLDNQTDYSWNKKRENTFTPNRIQPLETGVSDATSDIFYIQPTLRLRLNQTYISRPDMKVITGFKGPELYIRNRTAVPAFSGEEIFYSRLETEITQSFSTGLAGSAKYQLIGGNTWVFNDISVFDLKHFNGRATVFTMLFDKTFFLINQYDYSTSKSYLQFHYTHNFDGFIMNKIPLLRRTPMSFLMGINALAVKDLPVHYEGYVGLNDILRIARVDFAYGYTVGKGTSLGLRFGFTLGGL